MPTLTVTRDKGWADKVRKYRILLNGLEIGRIGEGELLQLQIPAGSHAIEARIDWCGSRLLRFDVDTDDIGIVVRSALRGGRVFLGLWYITFCPRRYLAPEFARRGPAEEAAAMRSGSSQ